MRARTKLALGGGIITTATALGIAVGGIVGAGTLVVAGPGVTSAHADGLKPFDSCAALLDWYVARGVRDVGPYGWDSGVIAYDTIRNDSLAVVPQAATKGFTDARANSATGTNTQEAGVDEPDIAKTDGKIVVRLVREHTLVVSDVTGAQSRELGRLQLPPDVYGGELLLSGEHVLVLIGGDGGIRPLELGGDIPRPMPSYGAEGSRVLDVDISDPAVPRLAHVDRYSGRLVSARTYGDEVRLVTTTGRPELNWTQPGKGVSPAEAVRRNRALVRRSTIEDWLPSVTTNGQRSQLAGCSQVMHPQTWAGEQTLVVTTFKTGDIEDRDSVAITADGQVVYSSTDRLYVASTRMDEPVRWQPGGMRVRPMPLRPLTTITDLHAFALDGARTTYVASGSVRGILRDRWSMDSYDGVLRVAWTRESGAGVRNGITTLAERDGALVPIGEIGDLGIDENLQSVRWFDGLAVLVTFRQIDPLYTIDLSDPAHPRELGALKIPGYSGYLHPIGDGRLLGLGVAATDQGLNLGSQAAVFDISDPSHPERISRAALGTESELPATQDPRAFTWLPDARAGLTPVMDWNTGKAHLVEVKVRPGGAISAHELAAGLDGWQTRILPLPGGRVAIVDRDLRILDVG
jgi:uncharacterized secreted protein with C-terminal beta-propeller domain